MALVVGIEIGRGGPDAARRAEEAGFGFVTLDDATPDGTGPWLDPVTVAAFASATTSTIGLVPVVHAAHAEPFHVSNQLSSLDHGSRGRAGWIVGTEASQARARAIGASHTTDPRLLRAEASEVVDAARRLWDSWEDDAIIADESTGRFLDVERMHYTDFRGEVLSVKGPALVPRPPQGQVVVFAAEGALRPGLVDVALVTGPTEARLRTAAAAATAPRVVAEVGISVQRNGSAAALVALLQRLDGVVDGVRLIPAAFDADLAVLRSDVLPALPPPPPGATLRDRFRLERPANRYAPAEETP